MPTDAKPGIGQARNQIWAVLQATGCTSGSDYCREQLFAHALHGDQGEVRICDLLGSGGKFYWDSRRWYVGCYPEDATPLRDDCTMAANARLTELRRELHYD